MPKKKVTDEDIEVRKKLITEALKIAIKFIMKNHVYEFDNKIHKQEEGGAIGVELTGDLAQVFMVWWMKQFLRKTDEQTETLLYKRYVDDINIISTIPNDIDMKDITIGQKEKETAMKLKEIGDSVHGSIILETDCPSNHDDNKLPILDLKVWLEEKNGKHFIMHEFYQKEVSSMAVINARSTLPWKNKRTILVQETLRVLRNCSRDLPWEVTSGHITTMMARMQYSGYDQKFRYDVVTTALAAYKKMKEREENGETPMYRPKEWMRPERNKLKESKKKTWYKKGGYKSVIFVPCTPDSELMKRMDKKIKESGIEIKLIEKSGRTLGNVLRTSDPRKEKKCRREDCPVCTTGGKGNCKSLNANYKMTCECNDPYTGTTTRSSYVRGKEHLKDLNDKNPESDLWEHCRKKHDGNLTSFRMDVIETFKQDPLLRQITEAVRINRTDKNKIINKKEEFGTTRYL